MPHSIISQTVYPKRCAYCESVLAPTLNNSCESCNIEKQRLFLGEIKLPSVFCERSFSAFRYKGTAKKAILRLKYRFDDNTAQALAGDMVMCISSFSEVADDIGIVTFVPQSAEELSQRGFNQSRELALRVAQLLGVELYEGLLKTSENVKQHTLGRINRKGNVLGVFSATDCDAVRGKTVLIVDDVMTTGATTQECAKMLLIAGAKRIYRIVFAFSPDIPRQKRRIKKI